MLKNTNLVRYLVLVINEDATINWYPTCREKIPDIIASIRKKKVAIKILRFYPRNVAFDTATKREYNPKRENHMIERGL